MESIESLVSEVKNDIFSELDNVHAFVSPSAYDTAWLAIIPSQDNQNCPMFKVCLEWILENQKEGGFWGETNEEGLPTIDALPATLACMRALKLWNSGHPNIQSGLSFIHAKAEILLKTNYQSLPRWFILTFPAMIELAEEVGLDLVFPPGLRCVIANIFLKRHHILQMQEIVEEESLYFPPLLSHFETLPPSYYYDRQETVKQHLSSDGSLFQSPSATAHAFLSTGNIDCLKYLQSLLLKFPNNGVPAKYPVDGDLIKLCIVDHVQGLGVAEYFDQEIEEILAQIYRNQRNDPIVTNNVPVKLFKEALAFRLLRMNGHRVNPGGFCWFLKEPKIVAYMEKNSEQFISAMYSVYRATDLLFPGETELEEARSFAIKMLQNSKNTNNDHNLFISKGLQNLINYELSVPWSARLDRLYHRRWIEENQISPLSIGKASFYRMSCLDNKKLKQLAVQNYEFQQSIYIQELEELKGWSKKWRLSEMGFGREKTVYTYFAVASCSCLPYNSIMRLVIAKAAIIVTVADDFYDMEGSLHELEILTDAVKRWDGEGLKGHSKTIFDALDDFVNDIAAKSQSQQPGATLVANLKEIWRETFVSWMVERRWSLTGYIPSMDEYLATGCTSIAAHTIALPATTFFNQNSSTPPFKHRNITKLLMAVARLANDIHSYQKEEADGKMNLVLLHLHQHPNLSIEDSVTYVKQMLETKRKEFMEQVLMDIDSDHEDMARSCKKIHLYCMKVFQMFFNSANLFDSETALLEDINKEEEEEEKEQRYIQDFHSMSSCWISPPPPHEHTNKTRDQIT
ncbi:hypothetical protein ACS0TY_032067 [Phlomoides rotata]